MGTRDGNKNFSNEELLAFVSVKFSLSISISINVYFQAVEGKRNELFDNISDPAYRDAIRKSWKEVRDECLEQGHTRFDGKTVAQLRDDIWRKKRNAVIAKYDNSQKTGKGGVKWEEVCA